MKALNERQRDRIIIKLLKDHAPTDMVLQKSLQELRKTYHNVQTQNVRLQKKVDAFKGKVSQPKAVAKTRHYGTQTSGDLKVQSSPKPATSVPEETKSPVDVGCRSE